MDGKDTGKELRTRTMKRDRVGASIARLTLTMQTNVGMHLSSQQTNDVETINYSDTIKAERTANQRNRQGQVWNKREAEQQH
eukprot:6397123-Lingulodinium_polyedra.AAC.1